MAKKLTKEQIEKEHQEEIEQEEVVEKESVVPEEHDRLDGNRDGDLPFGIMVAFYHEPPTFSSIRIVPNKRPPSHSMGKIVFDYMHVAAEGLHYGKFTPLLPVETCKTKSLANSSRRTLWIHPLSW